MKTITVEEMIIVNGGKDVKAWIDGACVAVGVAGALTLLTGPAGAFAGGFCVGWTFPFCEALENSKILLGNLCVNSLFSDIAPSDLWLISECL